MSKRIEYIQGQIVGPYGLIFNKETEPHIDKKTNRPIRQAEFICPHCDKHTHFIARIANVKNGHTKSCGCLSLKASINTINKYNQSEHTVWNRQQINEGDTVGNNGVIYLYDVEPYLSPKTHRPYRRCVFRCPICGELFTALLNNVQRNYTKGCGIHQSYGEQKVADILKENNYDFIRQYTFSDLKGKSNHPLFFDFYLPNYNCCIEYDGIQHFEARDNNSKWNTTENLIENQKRDEKKNKYCLKNNIKLIRIPYTDFDILDSNYLISKIESKEVKDI